MSSFQSFRGICSTGVRVLVHVILSSGTWSPCSCRGSERFCVVSCYQKQEAEPEEVSWAFGPESNYSVLLQVHHGADTPTWSQPPGQVPAEGPCTRHLILKIENLTCEDSGQCRARVSFSGGLELSQVFLLTVYGK